MASQQEALSVVDPAQKKIAQLVTADRVQPVEGFIQDQQLWFMRDGLRDLAALSHAQRIRSNGPPHGVLHAYDFQRPLCSPRRLGSAEAMQPDQVLHPI